MPLWSMIFAVATTQQMVKTVFQLDFTVLARTWHIFAGDAFWIRPPIKVAKMMMTPGVLIHANVRGEAPSTG